MIVQKKSNLIYNSKSKIKSIICAYQNKTSSLQIIKIENVDNFYWEKVIFPWQRILFHAVEQAELTIYSHNNATAILIDTIDCLRLKAVDSLRV